MANDMLTGNPSNRYKTGGLEYDVPSNHYKTGGLEYDVLTGSPSNHFKMVAWNITY